VQGFTATEPFDLAGMSFAITPSWTFAYDDSYSDADGTAKFDLHGTLSVTGGPTGTLRIDMALNIQGFGVVHCSTGDVTWNAS